MSQGFTWIPFYMELADRLAEYKEKRRELVEKVNRLFLNPKITELNIKMPKLERDCVLVDFEPFTFYALFNKGLAPQKRTAFCAAIAEEFGIKSAIPNDFDGVPVVNNQSATFYYFLGDRNEHDVDHLWEVFTAALNLADTNPSKRNTSAESEFIRSYEQVLSQKGVRWNLSMGLFWIRPYSFVNLDSRNRLFFYDQNNLPKQIVERAGSFKNVPNGSEYLNFCRDCKELLAQGRYPFRDFPELSLHAWEISTQVNQQKKQEQGIEDENTLGDVTPPDVPGFEDEGHTGYSKEDFLAEVYMQESDYDTLAMLLEKKQNIILQGAPGVGKTFAAKRLAYSIMGEKNSDRVMMIQFHQSYSYEDFMMGFRPSANGFVLKTGPFYNFCKRAEEDRENKYFFIIDEINRGNLSKIFGELFVLLEKDKRNIPLQLLYSDEEFTIPDNLYLIGMMNTADRSLAVLDYALRRRFAFFEFSPAFQTQQFRDYQTGKENLKFDRLISAVEQLNQAIQQDEMLGKGFRIGHSYFCTKQDITDQWLSATVTYELLPLLEEYWFDEPSKVKNWAQTLREAIR